MNTEIFDYFRKLTKKEFFLPNFINICLSIVVIFLGVISLVNEAGVMLFTIMFGCATVVLFLNAYIFVMRKSKVGWFIAAAGVFMCALTIIGITMILNGY